MQITKPDFWDKKPNLISKILNFFILGNFF